MHDAILGNAPLRYGPQELLRCRSRRRFAGSAVALAASAGCTVTAPVSRDRLPSSNGDAPLLAASDAPVRSAARSLDGYKRDVALHIYRQCPDFLFEGIPPPTLRAVVVLALSVDPQGQPRAVSIVRSNGYDELEARALKSVARAAPLPRPDPTLVAIGRLDFVETWLFRQDGRFQLRTLAQAQAREPD